MSAPAHHAPRPLGVVLIGPVLMILVPVGTFVVGVSTSTRTAGPFVVIALLHLLVLAAAAWLAVRALRGREPWRLSDLAGPVTLAIGAGLSLFLTFELAHAVGIQGSAIPRLRHGIPLPPDLPYVIAVGFAVAALPTAALAALAPLARGLVERLRERAARRRAAATEVAESDAPGSHGPGTRAPDPAPVRYATGPEDSGWTRLVSPMTRVLTVLSGLASLACLLLFSLRPFDPDTAELLTIAVIVWPTLPVLWAVVESLWRLDAEIGPIVSSLWRGIAVPILVSVVVFVPLMLVSLLPPIWRGFSTHHVASIGDGGLVAADAPVVVFLGLGALMAMIVGMGGALAANVFVVIPWVALFRPRVMIGENEMSTDPADRRKNVLAVRLMAGMIVMIFVVSILIVLAENGQVPGWTVPVSVAVLVGLTAGTYLLQRVDHKARERSGTSALVPSPFDPPPAEDDESEDGPTSDDPDTSR